MPTQRIPVLVLLSVVVLFACNNNDNKARIASSKYYVVATSLPNYPRSGSYETAELSAYHENFVQHCMQKFTVSSKGSTVVTGRKGLKVTINPAALEKTDGSPVDGIISLDMAELTNYEELFKSNAATVSNGRLLSSGGSYFIALQCGGQQLRVKDGKAITVEFPRFREEAMQLFYGENNAETGMNWSRAGMPLIPAVQAVAEDDLRFNDETYGMADRLPDFALDENKQPKIYKTLKEEIYYYKKKMSIQDIVDTINRYRPKIFIDTLYMWPKQLRELKPGTYVDSHYLAAIYGPSKQYILKTYYARQQEKLKAAIAQAKRDSALNCWVPKSLAGQLQKYYTPTKISRLGWLNCDCFYQYEKTDIPLELPVTFNSSKISYFILYRSMNGMESGKIAVDDPDSVILHNMPVGAEITLIAFTKNKGQLFHCKKEDFVIRKNKPLQLDFKAISPEEMTNIFGKNVKV